jgi:hypothetical protein
MKKTLLTALVVLSFAACDKSDDEPEPDPTPAAQASDNVAPAVTLNGKAKDTTLVGSTYADAGATATDNVDGNITSKITVTGTVNTQAAGDYVINYSVKDQAGNSSAPVQRMVRVNAVAAPAILSGNYAVACTATTLNPGVDPDLTVNSTYNSALTLATPSSTMFGLSSLRIGPVTGPANNLSINGSAIYGGSGVVNAPNQTYAYCTGTLSPSKTTFTIETKYFETMYPNKFYQVRNVFTKQ